MRRNDGHSSSANITSLATFIAFAIALTGSEALAGKSGALPGSSASKIDFSQLFKGRNLQVANPSKAAPRSQSAAYRGRAPQPMRFRRADSSGSSGFWQEARRKIKESGTPVTTELVKPKVVTIRPGALGRPAGAGSSGHQNNQGGQIDLSAIFVAPAAGEMNDPSGEAMMGAPVEEGEEREIVSQPANLTDRVFDCIERGVSLIERMRGGESTDVSQEEEEEEAEADVSFKSEESKTEITVSGDKGEGPDVEVQADRKLAEPSEPSEEREKGDDESVKTKASGEAAAGKPISADNGNKEDASGSMELESPVKQPGDDF